MRRTFLGAAAVGCAAVLLSTVPAFADGTTPSTRPSQAASPVPTAAPGDRASEASPVASAAPTRAASAAPAPARDQVSVVPAGAPNTGVTGTASDSGSPAAAIGGAAATALLAGAAGVFVVRRRRATGA
ncbi:sortase-dependent protein [Streptomyces griseoviridis]|uniref:Tat pathway signal sequence domain protein n=1 Tax=Streptomyces griseoviridis TaxID=45398 RepID=A0A3Q9KUR5_STRGD|nr:Tat pathway signal sequence domain protein [Streptomyces griseoviridis]AZS84817.1 Tat pathway signal sequence domain protein [Streptomyces griseoviridis]QCN88329.1 Tat pathway signal sequence domain protein [Streptomyces griseoviridis]